MKNRLFLLFTLLLLAGTVSCDDDKQPNATLTVNGGDQFLSLDAKARTGKLTIQSLSDWQVTRAAGDDWFTLSADEGPAGRTEITITLDANDGSSRSATLAFTAGKSVFGFVLSQSAPAQSFNDADYYFYFNLGTLPTLYSGLHVLSHDKPSYIFYGRTNTFVPAEFPSYVTVLTDPNGAPVADNEEHARVRTEFKRLIRGLNAADPTATFGLYVDDLRARVGYDWFVAQGIDSARVRVSLLSDGTGTYNNFAAYFGDPATAEQNWVDFAGQVEALDWNHGGQYPETRALPELESWEWPFYLSTRPGYRLLLQDASLLESSGPFMTARLAQMQTLSVQPYELLQSLTPDAQARFYRMASFDRAKFKAQFDASPKPNLVIIGTNRDDSQRGYVGRIVKQYGSQYDIFFKPHPSDKTSAGYETEFPGLKLLPGQMPFEIFVWSLIDEIALIGGFPSTVFLTVPLDKVGFIFAPNAAAMPRPLNLLFRDADVEWIQ